MFLNSDTERGQSPEHILKSWKNPQYVMNTITMVLTSAPIGAWKCNFPALLGNNAKPTYRLEYICNLTERRTFTGGCLCSPSWPSSRATSGSTWDITRGFWLTNKYPVCQNAIVDWSLVMPQVLPLVMPLAEASIVGAGGHVWGRTRMRHPPVNAE